MLQAGERAVGLAQVTHLGAAGGGEVAVQQVAAVLVDADIELLRALRIEAFDRRVAIDRVELVRADVAKQAIFLRLVRIERRGQQVVALDGALEEERGTAGGAAVATLVFEPGQLGLEGGACGHGTQGQVAALGEVQHAFDDAHTDHRTHLGQQRQSHFLDQIASSHADARIARLARWQQMELGRTTFHEYLRAGLGGVQVVLDPAATVALQRELGPGGDGDAGCIDQAHLDDDGCAQVCAGHFGQIDLDHGQLVGRGHADLYRRAVGVTEVVDPLKLQGIAAGLEQYADVLPGADLLAGELRLLAYAASIGRNAVDGQAQ